MWQKLTWMLLDRKNVQGSSQDTVRVLIYQWRYATCFIWNFIKLSLSPLSLFLTLTHSPTPSEHRHTLMESLCEPGQFPVLMTSCLQTQWTVSQGSWSLTPSHRLSEACVLSLYSNDLWPNMTVSRAQQSLQDYFGDCFSLNCLI